MKFANVSLNNDLGKGRISIKDFTDYLKGWEMGAFKQLVFLFRRELLFFDGWKKLK